MNKKVVRGSPCQNGGGGPPVTSSHPSHPGVGTPGEATSYTVYGAHNQYHTSLELGLPHAASPQLGLPHATSPQLGLSHAYYSSVGLPHATSSSLRVPHTLIQHSTLREVLFPHEFFSLVPIFLQDLLYFQSLLENGLIKCC